MIFSFLQTVISSVTLLLSYISGGGSFPKPLSAEEERKYIELYRNGDKHAKEVLIEHNLRLVAHIAKKYTGSVRDSEDIISIGTIGLIKGISSFDPSKGTRLATYVARCVDNSILTQWKHLIMKKYLLQENGIYIVKLMKNYIYSTEIRVAV